MNRYFFGAICLAAVMLLGQTPLHAADKKSLPTGAIREGSFCNKKLTLDASVAVVGKLARMGYTYDVHKHPCKPYILSMPQGSPGERRWTERWVYSIDGKEVPITIDFREAGLGAADYAIRR
jgi:hypothetical protein